jgi:DNA polymerase I
MTEKFNGLLLDLESDGSLLKLFVKDLDNNKTRTVIDDSFQPYFFFMDKKEKADLIQGAKQIKQERGGLKVIVDKPGDVPQLRQKAAQLGEVREAHIPYHQRYLIDKGIKPMKAYEWTVRDNKLESIKEAPREWQVVRTAFDIETYNPKGMPRSSKDPIVMTSFQHSTGRKGIVTWRRVDKEFATVLKNEDALLEKSLEELDACDVLYTYNGDNFDLPYLKKRCDKKKKACGVTLSRGGQGTKASLQGKIHVDAYSGVTFLSTIGALRLPRYTLEDVYKEFTGKEKLDIDTKMLWKIWDEGSIDELSEYSLQDAEATYVIGEQLLPLYVKLSKLLGQTVFDVSRMSASHMVELLLLKRAFQRGEIAPNKPSDDEFRERIRKPIKGGFVKQPESGLHDDLVVLDFRSLYPSIIISHNVSPETLDDNLPRDEAHVSPNGYHFHKEKQGIIPAMLEELINKRVEVKKKLKQASKEDAQRLNAEQRALKIVANATYGYLLFARARWYCRECGEAVTAWGRHYVQDLIDKAGNAGFDVLYGDSLDYDRRIFVKNNNGINLVRIGEFVEECENPGEYETLSFNQEKNRLEFNKVKKAIKHKYDNKKKGNLLEITTRRGKTVVTPQHSVYSIKDKDVRLCDASKLKKGDCLVSMISPPTMEKHKEGQVIDAVSLLKENKDLRAYADLKRFPSKKKKEVCPFCHKKYVLYSHVSTMHQDRKVPLEKATAKQKYIGSKTAGGGRIPRYWKLSKDLMWVLGYYCADGSASSEPKKMISFGSKDKKKIEKVKKFFDSILDKKMRIVKSVDKRTGHAMHYYRVQRGALVELIVNGFKAGKKAVGKQVPPMVFNSEEKLKKAFLEGYTDGDGSIVSKTDKRYKTPFKKYSSKSKDLAIGVHYLLKTVDQGKTARKKSVNQVYWGYRKDKPLINNLRTISTDGKTYDAAEIVGIKKVSPSKPFVYDLEVEKNHNFLDAEGLLLVHNTDSVFLKRKGKTKEEVEKFLDDYNKKLPESMRLELEGFYPRGIFVTRREGGAAKKRYALIREDGQVEIKGLEFVRRDWSGLAKTTQEKVIKAVLENRVEDAKQIVSDTVEDLRKNRVDLDDLVIYTQLKRRIKDYASKGPHVRAAERLEEAGEKTFPGMTIGYVVTRGAGNIGDRSYPVSLVGKREPDPEYYIGHQVLPAVMKILAELDIKEGDLKFKGTQSSLEDWA